MFQKKKPFFVFGTGTISYDSARKSAHASRCPKGCGHSCNINSLHKQELFRGFDTFDGFWGSSRSALKELKFVELGGLLA